mgnify:CR=1 FL=1
MIRFSHCPKNVWKTILKKRFGNCVQHCSFRRGKIQNTKLRIEHSTFFGQWKLSQCFSENIGPLQKNLIKDQVILHQRTKVWCSLLPLCYKQRERNLSLLPLPEMAETPHRLRNNVSDKARILFTPLFTRGNVLIPKFLCSESPILIPMLS